MFTLTTEPYYDTWTQCYKNIITINIVPRGPLRNFVIRLPYTKLGPNRYDYSNCGPEQPTCRLALVKRGLLGTACCGVGVGVGGYAPKWGGCGYLMTPDDIPNLFTFMTARGYTINTAVTDMLNVSAIRMQNNRQILCFASFEGNEITNKTINKPPSNQRPKQKGKRK